MKKLCLETANNLVEFKDIIAGDCAFADLATIKRSL